MSVGSGASPRFDPDPPPAADDGAGRDALGVIEDHLALARRGFLDEDLSRNYSHDLVVLDRDGCHHGFDGMRRLADKLRRDLPDAVFGYSTVLVDGRVGFLEWTAAASNGARVEDGADSYLVEGGRIVAQTVQYTVIPPGRV